MDSLVSTQWLAEPRDDENIRIVDVRWYLLDRDKGARAYANAHIPNAIYLHIDHDLSAPPLPDAKTGRHPLPDAKTFEEIMARTGISNTTHVVAYDDAGGANAARLWWLLRYFGHGNVSLLDGGLNQWTTERRLLTADIPKFPRAEFHAHANPQMLVTKQEMTARTRDARILILDARAPERYRGETEPVDARAGHIPGAVSAPLAGNLRDAFVGGERTDFRFQDADALRARFSALGAHNAQEIIAYCGSGVNAAAVIFALELAGFHHARLYAASFSEWSRAMELPIVTGSEPF